MVLRRKGQKGIFSDNEDTNSDDDNSSTSSNIPTRRLKIKGPVNNTNNLTNLVHVAENDDKKEKLVIRNSLRIDKVMIANQSSSNIGQTGESINEYCTKYIQMAMENKINKENAFKLHLIDMLQEHLKEVENFQVASSSLDAASKIYAGRVDVVHQTTYQVLTGLGSSQQKSKSNEVPDRDVSDGNDNDDDDIEIKLKKPKRNKNIFAQNMRKIRIPVEQFKSEIDPLFQRQAEKFDEGGTGHLKMNNIRILDTYQLLLDSDMMLDGEGMAKSNRKSEFFAVPKEFIELLSFQRYPISSQFEDFKFTGWTVGDLMMNETATESFKTMQETDIDQMEVPCDAFQMTVDNFDCPVSETFQDQAVNSKNKEELIEIDDDDDYDNTMTICNSRTNDDNSGYLSSVKNFVNSVIEDYSETNIDVLGMWAGPEHFKKKAVIIRQINLKHKGKRTSVNKDIIPIFPEFIDTRLDANGIGRINRNQNNLNLFKSDKTQLTDMCLNRNIKKDYCLPLRTIKGNMMINQMMNREISLLSKALKKHADQVTELDDEKVESYDYDNAKDKLEFCPKIESFIADEDGNVAPDNVIDNDDSNNYDNFAGGFADDDEFPYEEAVFEGCPETFGNDIDPITANVRRIEQIDIDYAKTAKRINVRALKKDIWNFCTESISAEDISVVKSTKLLSDVHMVSDCSHLSDLLSWLMKRLPPERTKDLSVPIIFNCLLHLSNEAGLDLELVDHFSNLNIGQGYSDFDIEQLNLFGISSNNGRKRKLTLDDDSGNEESLSSNVSRPKLSYHQDHNTTNSSHSFFSDVDMDEDL